MSAEHGMKINNFQRPINLIEIANRNSKSEKLNESGEKSFKEMFSAELGSAQLFR